LRTSASRNRPIRLSDPLLNVIGLSYLVFLGFEVTRLHHGLLRSVSHLLLFTTAAKLASLKRPGEARTALLVTFLLALASASSATHVSSLLYFAAMGWIAFRTLTRMAVLADFDSAPPARVLTSVPTGGLAAVALLAAGIVSVPFFYALPRLRSPFATAPLRIEEALSSTLTADRVELENFGSAKRSDRVVLSMEVQPGALLNRALRLREAVFTEYHNGVWTRSPDHRPETRMFAPRSQFPAAPASARDVSGKVSINLNLFTNGFLFLPYGATNLEVERGFPMRLPDGVVQAGGSRRAVRYSAEIRAGRYRIPGVSAIDASRVPPEIREYANTLTGDLDNPAAIYDRIEERFRKEFVYTLDPPRSQGDPVAYFLRHSKAGHCEFFASAAALMLTARGVPARLVTGSYGGELGFFSRSLIVRGGNLHAWVEADLDGSGFVVLDPTPAAGIPEGARRVSWLARLTGLGREMEFFYDRRVLGFDSIDQAQAFDTARQGFDRAATELGSWKENWRSIGASAGRWMFGASVAAALWLLLAAYLKRLSRLPAATRAYLAARHLLERRLGFLPPSVPPAEVARLLGQSSPEAAEDARRVVTVYCASAFGGLEPDAQTLADLDERVKRLKKLA
ncbi:MAG TPA: transglutaminaseTgpA domain-containing protein, partial [Thermoanaerobaculia bacterium]|nr:transglutaminaseTgpA domain-containing protein [Thermoanaerobaculia bacterium]